MDDGFANVNTAAAAAEVDSTKSCEAIVTTNVQDKLLAMLDAAMRGGYSCRELELREEC